MSRSCLDSGFCFFLSHLSHLFSHPLQRASDPQGLNSNFMMGTGSRSARSCLSARWWLCSVTVVLLSWPCPEVVVLAAQAPPTDRLPVTPPQSKRVANCPTCRPPVVPEECSFVPKLLTSAPSAQSQQQTEAAGGRRRRELLAVKDRAAARSARRKRAGGGGGGAKKSSGPRQATFKQPAEPVVEAIDEVINKWSKLDRDQQLCGIFTKQCAERYASGETLGLPTPPDSDPARRHPLKRIFKSGSIPDGATKTLFPDLEQGAFGSCAVVAVGDNLLRAKHGEDIDAHDTVIRYNAPMKKYASQVGRRSTLVYWKFRSGEKEYGQEGDLGTSYFTFKEPPKYFMAASPQEQAKLTYKGKHVLWPSMRGNELWMKAYATHAKYGGKGIRASASGGFKLASDIVSSGLCKRVSLYGYSSEGGAKYFNQNKCECCLALPVLRINHCVHRHPGQAITNLTHNENTQM